MAPIAGYPDDNLPSKLAGQIKNLDIDGAISIELEYAPQPDQIVAWVREAYQTTDMLLRAAGLRT